MPFWPRCSCGLRGDPQSQWCRVQTVHKRHLSRSTSVPVREAQHAGQHALTKLNIPLVKQHVDPSIKPHSLRETLLEHRRANRDGQAINGIPNRSTKLPRRQEARATITGEAHTSYQEGYKRPEFLSARAKIAEYGGISRPLTLEWRTNQDLPSGLRMPWNRLLLQNDSTQHNVPAKQRLLDEINAMHTYLHPTMEEDAATQRILQEILRTLDNVPNRGNFSFEIIGSRATGIHGPLSDIDLTIHSDRNEQYSKEEQASLLGHIYKFLRYPPPGTSQVKTLVARKIRKGRVPLIDCEHPSSGLQVQIQCTNDDYESMEITKAYLAEFRTITPIYHIVKQMLIMRGLSNGMQGGISSYPLFHMVVASFKLQPHNTDPVSQLLGFLDLYSEIDFYTTGIEYSRMMPGSKDATLVRSGYDPLSLQPMLVPRHAEGPQYLMSLQDPSNLDNDLGRVGSLIKHVQATFFQAREQIRAGLRDWERLYKQGLDPKTHGRPILAWCLEGNYSAFEEQRRHLRAQTFSNKDTSTKAVA